MIDGETAPNDGGPRRSAGSARFGWLAGATLAGLAAAALLVAGCGQPEVSGTASPAPSAGVAVCQVNELQGQIVDWEGAAGSSIATVTLRSVAAAACRVADYQLVLADGAGRGQPLIAGQDVQPGFTLDPGQQVTTLVQVSNYCLAATPREPVSIRLDGTEEDLVFLPAEDGSSGVPPCNGAGSPSSISQQPWSAAGS